MVITQPKNICLRPRPGAVGLRFTCANLDNMSRELDYCGNSRVETVKRSPTVHVISIILQPLGDVVSRMEIQSTCTPGRDTL